MPLTPLTLVLGGARSGKSAFAEALVVTYATIVGQLPVYVATADVSGDAEMAERVRCHQCRRGNLWHTVETPLVEVLTITGLPVGVPVLLECLTLWLSNIMLLKVDISASIDSLLSTLIQAQGPVVVVSNEVGSGIIPAATFARSFQDHAGYLNQQVAAMAQRVIFVVAGLPLMLKAA